MQVLSYETYYLALIIFIVILFIMFFIIIPFIASLRVVFICEKRNIWRQNRWAIAPILQGILNMLNLLCKTVQEYPARLHVGYCATLQRVGYLARCCTQYIARYLARNIASCRQAFNISLLNPTLGCENTIMVNICLNLECPSYPLALTLLFIMSCTLTLSYITFL